MVIVLTSDGLLNLNLTSGTPTTITTHPYGRIRLIGAVLGFTPREMMDCREH
jgi:hypothetical protein